ncbi:DNA-binding protein, partial [Pseudomonas syringae pv. tagetis]
LSVSIEAIGFDLYLAVTVELVILGLEVVVLVVRDDPFRKRLFSVTFDYPEVVELSLDCRGLRGIPVVGFGVGEDFEY